MQFSALRQYAAMRFRDQGNIVVLDTDWKTYINDVYEDMLGRNAWYPWNEVRIASFTYTALANGVALPTDVWHVLSVWDIDNQFPLVPLEGRDQYLQEYPQQELATPGQPMHYRVQSNKLYVYPFPAIDGHYRLDVVQRPADLVNDNDVPVFPAQFHTALVDGALAIAYRDDGNLNMAQAYDAKYEARVKAMSADLLQPHQSRFYEPVDTFL